MNKAMTFGLLTAIGLSSGLATAAQNDLLTTDHSQKKHERKVQLQLNDMGVRARSATLPVSFCTPSKSKDSADKALSFLGLNSDCLLVGKWKFTIDQSLENDASEALLGRLAGKRYDRLTFQPGQLSLTTLGETLKTKADIKEFSFDVGSYSEFKTAVDSYLNENVAPLMGSILGNAKDARYQEMKDKEKGTFLATIAKEQSVPVKFIERLMNSAYVYAVYAQTPEGKVKIHLKKGKFSTNVTLNLKTRLALYRFNPDTKTFILHKEIAEKSGLVSASNRVYPVRPGNAAAIIGSFDDSYTVAAKASGIAVNTTLKEDDEFAIFGTIDAIDLPEFSSEIGENEDLRVDAPYRIYQYIDGEKTQMGWGKARSVASSETFKKTPADYTSTFSLIRGDAELKDQLREHPWTGVLGFVDIGTKTVSVDKIGSSDAVGGGTFTALGLGVKADLGYLFNAEAFSEIWLEMGVGLGVGGEDIVNKGTNAIWENTTLVSYAVDVAYRRHLGSSGIYVGGKAGIGGVQLNAASVTPLGNDLTISALTALDWGVQAGFLFSPNAEIFVNVQGLIPLGAEAESTNIVNAELSGGVDVNVGFAMHFKQIGGLARLMK